MPEHFGQRHKHVCVHRRKHGLILKTFLAYIDMVMQKNEREESILL
jgi:hypothetical protein